MLAMEAMVFEPAARSGWMLTRVVHNDVVTLGGGATYQDAQRAAEADAGRPIEWHEPDMAYAGYSAVVTVPGETYSRGYLIAHRIAAEAAVGRERRRYPNREESESRQTAFLAAFEATGTINGAARESGSPAPNHYRWLEQPRYARLFAEAQQRRAGKPA